ncbi:MAG: hypothetical protein NTX03_00385 [Bacteroidetes bacterium]|nr:hypothetical protein [Bacteroidota bacterium]
MKTIDICVLVLMVAGLAFYALCLYHFIRGKVTTTKDANDRAEITLGNFQLKSTSFVFLASISALFAASPVINAHIPTSEPKTVVVEKAAPPVQIKYAILGATTNLEGANIGNVDVSVEHFRGKKSIDTLSQKTDEEGGFEFSFDGVHLDDEFILKWQDPKGGGEENIQRFSPTKGKYKIKLKNVK